MAKKAPAKSSVNVQARYAALDRAQAIIEFDLDGTIRHANENFLAAMGYELDEIVGEHHRIFMDPTEAALPAYQAFWDGLRAGKNPIGEYRRVNKAGEDVWIHASYNPIVMKGRPTGVVKFATDITAQKLLASDRAGQLDAIDQRWP